MRATSHHLLVATISILFLGVLQLPALARILWPKFYGQVGAYDVRSPDEVERMAASGFHIAILGASISHSAAVRKYGINYLDGYAQWLGWKNCRPEAVALHICRQSTQQAVVSMVADYIGKHYNDPNMIGYYILDDDPGVDIRPMLRQIHTLVQAANKRADFPRPTVCAFNAVSTLRNYDPTACDIVMIYLYSRNGQNGGAQIDWSLQDRLPTLLTALRAHGWNPVVSPLIGVPQAFSYPGRVYATPTTEDVAVQSEAYCRAGAVALIAYAWHDGYQGNDSHELYNTPALVQGLQEGRKRCLKYWQSHSAH